MGYISGMQLKKEGKLTTTFFYFFFDRLAEMV
jgi:hypothetical protein